jgi:hypothetical protein
MPSLSPDDFVTIAQEYGVIDIKRRIAVFELDRLFALLMAFDVQSRPDREEDRPLMAALVSAMLTNNGEGAQAAIEAIVKRVMDEKYPPQGVVAAVNVQATITEAAPTELSDHIRQIPPDA